MAQHKEIKFEKEEKSFKKAKEFFELKISDAMDKRSWDVPIIEVNRTIIDVFAILCTNDHVWVVENEKNKKVVGVITESDFVDILPSTNSHSFFGVPSRKSLGLYPFENITQIMVHDPLTCAPNEKVKDVLHKIKTHNIRRLPVVDPKTNEILGEVTVHQLIRRFYNALKPILKHQSP